MDGLTPAQEAQNKFFIALDNGELTTHDLAKFLLTRPALALNQGDHNDTWSEEDTECECQYGIHNL